MKDSVQLGRAFGRTQIIAATAAGAMVLSLAWLTSEWWRAWVVVGIAAAVSAGHLVRGSRRLDPETALAVVFATGTLTHGFAMLFTGGIRSPLAVVWGVMSCSIGFSLRRGALVRVLLIPLATSLLMTALAILPRLRPAWLHLDASPRAEPWLLLASAANVVVVLVAGATLGARIRRIQAELRDAAVGAQRAVADGLREKNQALVTLTGAVAHELKNPLSAVLALSTMLEERARREGRDDAEHLRVMAGEARRMGAILSELLSFARPIDRLALEDVALVPALEEALMIHEGLAQARGVRLVLTGDRALTARADPNKLKQIFANLLQNALDASPEGAAVDTTVSPAGARGVAIVIRDRGDGIDPEIRGRLFVPGVSGKVAGSGLGLSVSRMLAESHGGELHIEDAPGGGCRTVLRLPRAGEEQP